MSDISKEEVLTIYRECLNHTLKIIGWGVGLIALLLGVFSFYIWKSFEVVPQTITASQTNSTGDNSISQGD